MRNERFLDFWSRFERSEKPPEALRVYKSSNLSVRNSSFLRKQKISCQMISCLTSFDHKITCPKDQLYPTVFENHGKLAMLGPIILDWRYSR